MTHPKANKTSRPEDSTYPYGVPSPNSNTNVAMSRPLSRIQQFLTFPGAAPLAAADAQHDRSAGTKMHQRVGEQQHTGKCMQSPETAYTDL